MNGAGQDSAATPARGAPRRRSGPRYVFQVESCAERTVLRVLDTNSDEVFREIPIEEFLAYARCHRNVKPFLLQHLPV